MLAALNDRQRPLPLRAVGLAALAALLLVAPSASADSAAPAERTLQVRGDADLPPYEFEEDGHATGFDVELIEAVAEVMGLKVEVRLGPWSEARADLEAGRVDALTGMIYSPPRDRKVDFSTPHSTVRPAIFLRKGSKFHSLNELKGHEIAVMQSDFMHDYLREHAFPARVLLTDSTASALRQLASGVYDAALLGKLQGLYLIKKYQLTNLETVGLSVGEQRLCFAVRQGDTELQARLNEGLAILKATGRYEQIYEKWFSPFEKNGRQSYQRLRRVLIWIFVPLIVLLAVVLVWTHALRRLVDQRTQALRAELGERKKAEQALREREEDYRRMFDAMADGLLIAASDDGAVLAANQAASELHRLDDKAFLERKLSELVVAPPLDDSAGGSRRGRTWPGGPLREVALGQRPDGSTFDAEVYRVPFRYQGKTAQLCVVRDVTELKQLENKVRRSEKMESLGRLAAGVAHDLNNVLSGLVGYPDLILYDLPESSPLREPLQTIKAAGERAAAIVQDLLVMARRGAASYTPVNLNAILEQFLRSPEFLRLQNAHPQVWVSAAPQDGLLYLSGSTIHLTKALTNLVANAMEAMPEGGPVILRTENRYLDRPLTGYDVIREGEYVCLTVADAGTGIAEEQLKHIFEPFYTSKVMGRSGTGLGLTLVWGTVSDHQGYIDVESTPGRGTTFRLYFPATRSVPTATAVAGSSLDALRGEGQEILVVDDVPEQRTIACGMLKALGYAPQDAPSGEAAVALLAERPMELVLLDMIMDPGIDGLETYRRILEVRPGQRAIIVSGYSETERAKEARHLGAGAYVRKPYILRQLAEAVHRELHREAGPRPPTPPPESSAS